MNAREFVLLLLRILSNIMILLPGTYQNYLN